ncbi:MAG: hypothetical protein RIS26_583 [Actinomycetota bacterium]
MEGLGRIPEPFRYARPMENEGIQLFINICIALIGLVILRIGLQVWDRKAKAKEAEAQKLAKKKKK